MEIVVFISYSFISVLDHLVIQIKNIHIYFKGSEHVAHQTAISITPSNLSASSLD